MVIRGKLLKHYPKIRDTDIGSDTSASFIDTLRMSNASLESIGGDYDELLKRRQV